jgi:rubredoxin---NAD+ reductase
MEHPILVIGSGLAAFTVVREIRKISREVPITLITREEGYFYSKPMLSTAVASGKSAAQLITTPQETITAQLGFTLMARTTVMAIDPQAHVVKTSQGDVPYTKLVLALGADPIRLPLQGDAADQVMSVNDLDDYAAFRQRIQGKQQVAILGAGLIGCEFANDLVAGGYQVSVIDMAAQPLGRLLPPQAADLIKTGLEAAGVQWHLGTTVVSVDHQDSALCITLANGVSLAADAVLSAVGLRPRTALAQAAGIAVNQGIVVDRFLQTNVSDVYALGDCAEVGGLVLPYVMPIMQAARALAPTLMGTPTQLSYPAMPVVVKTPAMPVVVSPPAPGALGLWKLVSEERGIDARFEDAAGNPLGMALVGSATAQKAAVTKLLPPVMA